MTFNWTLAEHTSRYITTKSKTKTIDDKYNDQDKDILTYGHATRTRSTKMVGWLSTNALQVKVLRDPCWRAPHVSIYI